MPICKDILQHRILFPCMVGFAHNRQADHANPCTLICRPNPELCNETMKMDCAPILIFSRSCPDHAIIGPLPISDSEYFPVQSVNPFVENLYGRLWVHHFIGEGIVPICEMTKPIPRPLAHEFYPRFWQLYGLIHKTFPFLSFLFHKRFFLNLAL